MKKEGMNLGERILQMSFEKMESFRPNLRDPGSLTPNFTINRPKENQESYFQFSKRPRAEIKSRKLFFCENQQVFSQRLVLDKWKMKV
jgi:hypothetical protein